MALCGVHEMTTPNTKGHNSVTDFEKLIRLQNIIGKLVLR